MATKPVFGTYIWAVDATYTNGPAPLIGTPTKVTPPLADSDEGWKADQKPPAQWVNFSLNLITNWTDWVRLGSNAFAEDAHIVETDSGGLTRIPNLILGGHSSAFFPSVQSLQPTQDVAGAFALRVVTTLANEVGVYFTTNTAIEALKVDKSAGAFGYAARFEGNTNGGAAAIFGQAADTVNDAVGLTLEPRATVPGGPVSSNGDLWYSSDHDALQLVAAGSAPVVHAGSGRLTHRSAESLGEDTTTVSGTPITKTSVSFGVAENLRTGSVVYIRAACEVGQNNTVLGACRVGLRDVTAGVDIVVPRTVRTFQSTSDASEKTYVVDSSYTIPGDGAREIALTYISDGVGGNSMFIRNATIEVEGQYVL